MIIFRVVDLPEPVLRDKPDDVATLVYDIAAYHNSILELIINGVDAYAVVRSEDVTVGWDFLTQHLDDLMKFIQAARRGDVSDYRIKRTAVDEGIIIEAQHSKNGDSNSDIVDIVFSHDIRDFPSKEIEFLNVSLEELELSVLRGCKEFYDRSLKHYLSLGLLKDFDIPEWKKCWKENLPL